MKLIRKILLTLWLALAVFYAVWGFFYLPEIPKNQPFVSKEITPYVNFVKSFKSKNGRLPTNEEFQTLSGLDSMKATFYIRSTRDVIAAQDVIMFRGADWSRDFAISAWRGEWSDYYFSWKDAYYEGGSSWEWGAIGFVVYSFIVALPFIILSVRSKRRKDRLVESE